MQGERPALPALARCYGDIAARHSPRLPSGRELQESLASSQHGRSVFVMPDDYVSVKRMKFDAVRSISRAAVSLCELLVGYILDPISRLVSSSQPNRGGAVLATPPMRG
jgi:hypothetical protein